MRKILFYWIIIIIFIVVAVTIASFFYFTRKKDQARQEETAKEESLAIEDKMEDKKIPRYLDGVLVNHEDVSGRPLAIIIDNKTESLPPSGINQASLVYEFPVESGITRLLAIFAPKEAPQEIGPVRSARPYEVRLAEEYKSLFVHAGGSFEALEKISQHDYNIYNLDEIGPDGGYFWRASGRRAPHNLYTSGEKLRQALKDKEIFPKVYFTPWLFSTSPGQENGVSSSGEDTNSPVSEIIIDFSDYYYKVRWVWHAGTKNWWRYQRDLTYSDSRGEQIKAKNVIVQFCQMEVIDEIGRRRVDLESGDKALIFKDGQMIEGSWQKNKKRTKFFDEKDEEIVFNPGQTWIEIVSQETNILY